MKNQIISIFVSIIIAVVVSVTVTKALTNLQIDMELQEAYGGLVNRINVLDQSNDDAYQELNKVYQSLDAITYDESIDELASKIKGLEESVSTLEYSVISLDDRVSLLIRPLGTEEPTLVVEEATPTTPIVVEEVTKEPTKIIKDSWQEPTFLSCVDDRLSKPSTKSLVRALEKARSVGAFEFEVTYNVASNGTVNNVRVEDGIPIDIQRIATRYISKFKYTSADVGVNNCVYAMRLIVQQ